jgi:hypothetical protein
MLRFDVPKTISKRDRRLAWLVALSADAIQFVALPLFSAGGASPFDSATDIAAAVILCKLVGWHWAFLPAVLAELIPGLNLFPTWTAALLFVLRHRRNEIEVEIIQHDPPGSPRSLNP